MKKTVLIALVLLFLFGASCSEEELPQEQLLNCNCGVIIEKLYFTIPNSSFTRLKVKNNCTQEITTIEVPGNQGTLNRQWCND